MDIEWLEDFLVLSELSSFTRAAQSRNVTQSAFSRRIRSLEEWVGIPLIDRDTVPPRLTMAGYLFRDTAREMVKQLHETRMALGHRNYAFSGTKFFVSHTLAVHFFSDWILKLNQRVNGLKFELITGETYEGILNLSNARCDLLMIYSSPLAPMTLEEKAFPSIFLGSDRLVPVVAPTENGELRFPLLDAKSRNLPVLSYPPDTFFGRLCNGIVRFSSNHPQFNVIVQSSSSRVLHSLALHGIGIAWLPERTVKADLLANRLMLAGSEAWTCHLEIRIYVSGERARLLKPNLWQNIKGLQENSALVA
jgi:DNA-binding transcriptional LysR family regulator